jgi:hypothetical protein
MGDVAITTTVHPRWKGVNDSNHENQKSSRANNLDSANFVIAFRPAGEHF